jgi:hypothetical protein
MKTNELFNQNLPFDLKNELHRLSAKLEFANDDLEEKANTWANAEHTYRKAKSAAFIRHQSDASGNKMTIPMTQAMVDRDCEDQRFKAYLARAQKEAALEKVRSLRAQLSALQSVTASVRAELELTKY